MDRSKSELVSLLSKVPLVLTAAFLFLLPLLFSVQTTEAFLLPKQLLLGTIVIISMLSIGIRILIEGKIRVRTTPFDLPVLFFTIVVFISALLSINRFDSLTAAVSLLYAALLFYVITNSIKTEKSLFVLLSALIAGSALASLLTIFSFFNVYILPFAYTKSPYFTTFGTLFDQALYLALMLPISGYFAVQLLYSLFSNKSATHTSQAYSGKTILFSVGFFFILLGFIISLYYLISSQRPVILPFTHGFQIAFAAISQDAGRILKGFLFGSGYGTFLTDFTRFKQPLYNGNEALWSVTFLRSSSYVLELLATTGILGVLSFFFIVFKVIRERTVFLPLILAILAAFLFPFSPLLITIFFVMLGIFAVIRSQANADAYSNVEIHLVTLREGLFEAREETHHTPSRSKYNRLLPGMLFALMLIGLGGITYYTTMFAISDLTFQKSLIAAASNNGSQTYSLQRQAINTFPYRDAYHRVFSQTNLALANSLAQQTPAGASPSAQTQQSVLTLIQQSINSGRSATAIAPYTAVNWNNLSSVYRSLIGFGQNAEQFAVLTNQQAIALDQNNPQQYVNLGGIYYQLKLWDDASRQFQVAINLKRDYSNAYYNLGHTFESKGDYANALTVYELVRSMVKDDKENSKRIADEIEALKAKAANQQAAQVAGAQTETTTEATDKPETTEPLQVNTGPNNQLPERNPKAQIPAPSISVIPSPTSTPQ